MKCSKLLGLCVVMVVSVTALVSVGSASASKFTAGKTGAALKVTTLVKHTFTITGSSVQCNKTSFSGQTEALEAEKFTVTPTYSECTAFGFANAGVTPINCRITWWIFFTVKDRVDSSKPCLTLIHVNVPFIAKCTVSVGEQEANGLSWSNGSGDVVVKFNVTGIKAEVTESTGACPLTVGSHANATYTGESTIQAEGTTLSYDP